MEFSPAAVEFSPDADPFTTEARAGDAAGKENGKAPIPPLTGYKQCSEVMIEVERTLELMHDRCIARNLRAAGLGGTDVSDDAVYGVLDPNAPMLDGSTMLQYVLRHAPNHDKLHNQVTILLNEGADPNVRDGEGRTVLMELCLGGPDKVAKAVLAAEATNVFALDARGNSALHLLAAKGRYPLLKHYLKALRRAGKAAQGPTLELLSLPNADGQTPEAVADASGFLDLAGHLLQERSRRERAALRRLRPSPLQRLSRFTSLDSLLSVGQSSDDDSHRHLLRRASLLSLSRSEQHSDTRPSTRGERAGSEELLVIRPRSETGPSQSQASETSFAGLSAQTPPPSRPRPRTSSPNLQKPRLSERIRRFLRRGSNEPAYQLKMSGSSEALASDRSEWVGGPGRGLRERASSGVEMSRPGGAEGEEDISHLAQLLQHPPPRIGTPTAERPSASQPVRAIRSNPRLLNLNPANAPPKPSALPPIQNGSSA